MALGCVLWKNASWQIQRSVVGAAEEVPRHCGTGRAIGKGFRSGSEVPRTGKYAVHAILPRAHLPIPIPPRVVQSGRAHGPVAFVFDLRQQTSGGQTEGDVDARRERS